ncbi:hypothetical protein O6H91_09G033700 [Diphasiastrum complanatum]|uniref:Uncharacterized protein n=1 Tax=Diphasiastrum complanatum TaxID=34168 RepID=A0ACC2CN53_DIPCM|nr:hypothetical protein O6H91_09G033700 [Diphasiastrum complanatum]
MFALQVECQFTTILGSLVCHKKLRHLIIFEERSWHATKEVIALLVNLTSVPSFCEHIYEPMLVGKLLACAKDSSNPSLFKVMRNLSRFEVGTSLLSGFIPELVNALMDAQPSIQVEVMGILNNIASIKDMCCSILTRKHLLQFLSAQLGLNTTEDDLVLEIGIFIGSICSSKTASVISEARLVSSMCLLFPKKQYDKDLTVQFLYAFNQLLLYESTSKDFRACPDKMVMHVLKLRQDANKLVANMADIFMNVLMEIDQEWCIKIKWFNFSLINRMTFQGTI